MCMVFVWADFKFWYWTGFSTVFYSQLGWFGGAILLVLSHTPGNPVLMPTSLKVEPNHVVGFRTGHQLLVLNVIFIVVCVVALWLDNSCKEAWFIRQPLLFFLLKNGPTCFNNWSHFKLKVLNAGCPVEQAWPPLIHRDVADLSSTLSRSFYQTTDGQALFLTLLYWSPLCGRLRWWEQGSMFALFSVLRRFRGRPSFPQHHVSVFLIVSLMHSFHPTRVCVCLCVSSCL